MKYTSITSKNRIWKGRNGVIKLWSLHLSIYVPRARATNYGDARVAPLTRRKWSSEPLIRVCVHRFCWTYRVGNEVSWSGWFTVPYERCAPSSSEPRWERPGDSQASREWLRCQSRDACGGTRPLEVSNGSLSPDSIASDMSRMCRPVSFSSASVPSKKITEGNGERLFDLFPKKEKKKRYSEILRSLRSMISETARERKLTYLRVGR